jgi:hypothetical protein
MILVLKYRNDSFTGLHHLEDCDVNNKMEVTNNGQLQMTGKEAVLSCEHRLLPKNSIGLAEENYEKLKLARFQM